VSHAKQIHVHAHPLTLNLSEYPHCCPLIRIRDSQLCMCACKIKDACTILKANQLEESQHKSESLLVVSIVMNDRATLNPVMVKLVTITYPISDIIIGYSLMSTTLLPQLSEGPSSPTCQTMVVQLHLITQSLRRSSQ
jgi:hypothetical protein